MITQQQLEDMVAFIFFVAKNEEMKLGNAYATLAHDIVGIWRQDEYFVPRTSGYAERHPIDEE